MSRAGQPPARGLAALGERIRRYRQDQGWTQAQLARRAGISRDAISRIERGLERAREATLRALAQALGVEWSQLTGEEGQPRLFPLPDEMRVQLVRSLMELEDAELEEVEPELRSLLERRKDGRRKKTDRKR
ncbi:MAG: helix-turn-helix transcriptional regulator [Acidobacteriota bacterium]